MGEHQLQKSIYRLTLFISCFLSIVLSGSWLIAMRALQAFGNNPGESVKERQMDSKHLDSRDKRITSRYTEIPVIESNSTKTLKSLDTEVNDRQESAVSQEPSGQNGPPGSSAVPNTQRLTHTVIDHQVAPVQHQIAPTRRQVAPTPRQVAPASPRPLANGAPQPYYPLDAYRRRKEGSVGLRVWVNAKGVPQRVLVVKSSKVPELDRAAAQTMYDWRFQPAKIDGKAVEGQTKVTIDFKMNR